MTKEEISTANILIANFMGARVEQSYNDVDKVSGLMYYWSKENHKDSPPGMYLSYSDTTIKYHSSWDYLMPVVEKIESIHDDFHGYFGVYINSNSCTIQGTKLNTSKENFHPAYFANTYADTKIKATYLVVVEFIEWYNKELKDK